MTDPMDKFEELLADVIHDCARHGYSSAIYGNAYDEGQAEKAAKESVKELRDFVRALVEMAK